MNRKEKLIKLDRILTYLLEHLDTVTIESMAEVFGYNKQYMALLFKDLFDMPFYMYLKKLRLRRAAQNISDNSCIDGSGLDINYNYSSGFSNAFKKEFGCSPTTFLENGVQVPDLPMRTKLFGIPICMEYTCLEAKRLAAVMLYPTEMRQIDLMYDAAYALESEEIWQRVKQEKEHIGVWWMEPDEPLAYALCRELQSEEEPAEGERLITIPGNQYAVFYTDAADTREETLYNQRALVFYVFREWERVNRKITNTMGITYEVFQGGAKARTGICLPILKGMYGYEPIKPVENAQDQWIEYINRHIQTRITTQRIAEHFHYSENIFRSFFFNYFGITPSDYMRKRRLITAAEEYESSPENAETIALRYGFKSFDYLRKEFFNVFDTQVMDVKGVSLNVISLPEYYVNNKGRIRTGYEICDDFLVETFAVKNTGKKYVYEIPGLTSFWFREMGGECFSLWSSIVPGGSGEFQYNYYIGRQIPEASPQLKKYCYILVKGGKYVRFETLEESNEGNLTETFQLLERCAFFGWVKENRVRYDEKRITFVKYKERKLYFYVPIKR